jgi:hypothetical protein
VNEPHPQAIDDIPQPERPERWDEAIVAGYIYDLLRGPA